MAKVYSKFLQGMHEMIKSCYFTVMSIKENHSQPTKHAIQKISFLIDDPSATDLSNTSQEHTNGTITKVGCMSLIQPIHAIDLTASFVFPLAFIMYNLFYWSRNLDESTENGWTP